MANDKTNTELVKGTPQELAHLVPDFIEQGERSGTEHLTRDDMQMPRIGLAQQMSPEIVEDNAKYLEGLKIGHMFNNLTGEIYGTGPLEFCIVRADPPRYVEFIPRELGGGIADPNVPAGDPRTRFGPKSPKFPNGEPPIATKFYDFIVMFLPTRELIVLSLKSTGLRVAKQINGLLGTKNAKLFAGKYRLGTAMAENKKGRFAIFTVKNAGWLPDKETYDYCSQVFENLKDKVIAVDREHPDGASPADEALDDTIEDNGGREPGSDDE